MNTQILSLEDGIGPTAPVADIVGPTLNATVLLELEVSDPEVVAELQKHSEGDPRQAYALGALRLGVMALRQAAGALDATAIREAGQNLISSLAELLAKRGAEITTDLAGGWSLGRVLAGQTGFRVVSLGWQGRSRPESHRG
jgi:hypothetical protein